MSIFRSEKEETFVHATIAKIYFEKSSLKVFKTCLLLVVKEESAKLRGLRGYVGRVGRVGAWVAWVRGYVGRVSAWVAWVNKILAWVQILRSR